MIEADPRLRNPRPDMLVLTILVAKGVVHIPGMLR